MIDYTKYYLNSFQNHNDYEAQMNVIMGIPHVVSIKETNEVIYKGLENYANKYLTLNILSDGDMRWAVNHYQVSKTISYSKDNGTTWIDISSTIEGASIPVATGDVVIFKGDNSSYLERGMGCHFKGTAKFNAYGNVMSLIYGDDFVGKYELTSTYCLCELFGCSNIVNAENLVLPATTLTEGCYHSMFYDCKSLVNVPELPATTLAEKCYQNMFAGCDLLTKSPELPATTLAKDCYRGMFYGCTSLTTSPELPATTLTEGCYESMFYACKSLVNVPELPATTLARACYYEMFNGCTSLETAPELPATTLAGTCYFGMFKGCTSLETAPELPATTLAGSCYSSMFNGCTSLKTAPELPVTTLAFSCYYDMFNGCTSLETAPELPATTLTECCYEFMFNGCTSLETAPELPATTLTDYCYCNMFSGCTSLETAPELPATTLTDYCYSNMFSGCNNLSTLTKSEFIAFNTITSGFNGILKDIYMPKTKNVIINLSNTDEVIFNYSDGVYSALREEIILTDVLSEEVINTLTPEYNLTVTVYGNYPDVHIVKTTTLCEHITWESGQSLKEFSEKFGFNFKDSSISILYTSRNGGDYYYYYD